MAVGRYTVALDRRLGSKPGVSSGGKIGLMVPIFGIVLLAATVANGQPRSTVFSSIELPGGAAFNRIQVQVQVPGQTRIPNGSGKPEFIHP